MEWRGGCVSARALGQFWKKYKDIFERRGREDFAEGAEKKTKIRLFFLRLLRNLRVLCVQNGISLLSNHMKITLKLFASLTDYLPADARRSNIVELEVDSGASILQIIEPFGLPMKLVHLVLVNGHYINPEDRVTRTLVECDVLAIWPPIAGG
jgi:sulfur-carrier protein